MFDATEDFEENEEQQNTDSDLHVLMGDSMEQVTSRRPTFCAEFLLKLMEGRQLSHVALGDVIDGCRVLCSRTASDVNQMIQERLHQCGIDPSILRDVEIPDPFEQLSTSYLQEKYYRENFPYVVC